MKTFLLLIVSVLPMAAQYTGGKVVKQRVNNLLADSTAPFKTGLLANRPALCYVGDAYFSTDAASGSNISLCVGTFNAAGTWVNVSGGAGGSGTVTSVATGCGLSGGTITTTGTIAASMAVNAQTGTTYTVLNGDCGKLVSIGNASAVAVTLPQANGSTFIAGWYAYIQNTGAGAVTITPTTSTIDAAATLILSQNQGALIASDGTNYKTYRGMYPTFASNAVLKGGGVGAALIGSGVTIDVNNQVMAPGGFSTGGGPTGGPLILSGSTSGFVTIVCPAICGTPTLTPPTTSGTLMLTNTGVQATQLPALTGAVTSSAGSAATTITPMLSMPFPVQGSTVKFGSCNGCASGNVDLYTSGAGRRGMVAQVSCYNTAGTSTSLIVQIKISGSYFRLSATSSINTNVSSSVTAGIILEPTDSISINASQAGLNCGAAILDYPNTIPIYSPRLTSFSIGDNTVYTVPGGFTAVAISPFGGSANSVTANYSAESGHTATWFVVPSGGSTGTSNKMTPATAVSGGAVSTPSVFRAGSAGVFVVLNLDAVTGTPFAWLNVAELP